MAHFDGTDDYLDSREIIERIEELTAEFVDATETDPADYNMSEDDWALGLGEDGAAEMVALLALQEDAEHLPDWQYGVTLIHDAYFEDYARELVQDCGYIPDNLPGWIENAIDWGKVADALKSDYTDFEFRGETYWART